MATSPLSAKTVFDEAVEIASPEARRDYLDRACAGAPVLREQVEALLAAYADAGSFLESPPAAPRDGMDLRPAAERPGTRIGPYQLLQQIGEGGMGVVWLAEQTQPVQRQVALKVIKPGMDSRQVVARFEAERQALAVMDHVNIARVFDGGATEAGLPYFVMELVHGVPITKYCDDHQLTPRERLELFVPVCQAIQHAHQKGIIHRDIKPSNVMVALQDGKPVPKVIDFGVAKATEQKPSDRTLFTQCGTLVGTLEYMSPEQAEMSAQGVDTRSDIFSLGVLLYELLTGSTPLTHERMKQAAHAELLRLIKEEEPPKPSTRLSDSGEALVSISANRHTEPARLTKLLRGDLDWILLKCLEKDRTHRYETANGLAADILRHLNDEPVTAGAPGAGYRFRKFVKRNRAQVIAGGIVAGVLVLGVMGTTTGMFWALNEKSRANAERAEARLSLADSRLAQARAMRLRREIGFREAGLKLLDQAAAVRGSTLELRNEAVANLAQSDLVVESWLASTPDALFRSGAAMAADCLVYATRTSEFLVRPKMDTEHGEYRIAPPEAGDEAVSADLSPDGRYLICAFQKRFSYDVRLFGWDVAERRRLWTQPLPGQVQVLCWAFSPESPTVAIAHPDRTVRVHDLADASVVRVIPVGLPVSSLLFLRNGTPVPDLLIADREGARLVRWNLETGTSTELPLPGSPNILAQSNDGHWLAVGCLDGRIVVYRIDSRSWPMATQHSAALPHAILSGHQNALRRLSFSPSGELLVSYADDAATRFWDAARGVERFAPALDTFLIDVEAGRIALARGENQRVGLWRLQPGTIYRTLPAHRGVPACVAFVDGRRFAIGGDAGLSIWDAQAGVEMTRLHEKRVTGVHVLPQGLLVATFDGLLRWSMERTPQGPLFVGPDLLRKGTWVDMCVNPDNSTAFVSDHQDRVWRIPLANPDSATLLAEQRGARPKSVSPNGARLVVGHWGGNEVVVYSVADGSRLFSLPTPGIGYAIGAFGPPRADGDSLLIIATNERYHVLDGVTYAERHSIPRRGSLVNLAVSPAGDKAMITRSGSVAALIDLRSFEVLADLTLPEPSTAILHSTFDPSGGTLAMMTNTGRTLVWDVAAMRRQLGQLGLDWP